MNALLDIIILTRDEELNLPRCLESVAPLLFAGQEGGAKVWVVDSGSVDGTELVAREHGAEFVVHTDYQHQAQQFNWALDHLPLEGRWVLRLDADERLTPELAEEIRSALSYAPSSVTGYRMKRRVYFFGTWIRHGGYYPTWILRLFRRGKARSENREMDEHIVVSEGEVAELERDFIDDNHKGFRFFLAKHRAYAMREARAVLHHRDASRGKKLGGGQAARKRWLKESVYYRLPPFIRPLLYFLYRYFFRHGFLDGVRGLVFHFLQGFWYRMLVDVNIWKLRFHTS